MLVDPKTRSLVLRVDDPFAVRDLIPVSRLLDHPDYNLVVKHTVATTRVLRNIGIEAPAPILSDYKWPGKYKPFAHQRTSAEFKTIHRRLFDLSDPGVGKTASTLWAADWLMHNKLVRKVLILSPLSTLERVWMSDIFDVLMHRKGIVVHGPREKRLKALQADVDFYVMNHEGVNIQEVAKAIQTRPDIDLVIVDESSMFRNHGTSKYKALQKLIRPDMRLWMLTGTPCPNGPTDAWAQARLVSPERVPKFFGRFKDLTMLKLSQFKWAAKPDAYRKAYDALQPAIRFRKHECLDLPPVITMDRQAELSKEQRGAVRNMQLSMVAEAKNHPITAVNAADKLNKLRQIMCGAIKDPTTGAYIELDYASRFNVLLEAIELANAKVIVIVPFKGIIRSLAKKLAKHYSVAVMNGDVSPRERDKIVLNFKTQTDPHVLLCHPRVMSHGLNLTEADTLVFFGPIYSNDEMQQVTERFNRTGQTRKMTITRIAAHPLEWEIYKAVDTKKVSQDNILSLYKSMIT